MSGRKVFAVLAAVVVAYIIWVAIPNHQRRNVHGDVSGPSTTVICNDCVTTGDVAQVPTLDEGVVDVVDAHNRSFSAIIHPFRDISRGTQVTVVQVDLPRGEVSTFYEIREIGELPHGPAVAKPPQ